MNKHAGSKFKDFLKEEGINMDLSQRKRSIDINKLAPSDAENISNQLGEMVRKYVDEAVEKANKVLNIYGLKAKMQIVIMGINEDAPKEAPQKKKRGRRKKNANL